MHSNWEILKENRDLFLLVEIWSWLHDLGKLDKERMTHHCERNAADFLLMDIYREKTINSPFPDIPKLEESPITSPSILSEFVNEDLPCEKEFGKWLAEGLEYTPPKIGSPVFTHHSRRGYIPPSSLYELIICTADALDSGIDRQELGKDEFSDKEGVTIPFGRRYPVEDLTAKREKLFIRLEGELDKEFKNASEILSDLPKLRTMLLKILPDFLKSASADTRIGINDTPLWSHSYMTGAIARCLAARYAVKPELRKNLSDQIRQTKQEKLREFCNKSLQDLQNQEIFQIIGIKVNGFNYLIQSIRAVDYFGRKENLENFFKKVKVVLEEDLFLGVEIYRDVEGVYFLTPNLEIPKQEIEEGIVNTLPKEEMPFKVLISQPINKDGIWKKLSEYIRTSVLPQPLLSPVLKEWKGKAEVCDICGLFPAKREKSTRGERICHRCEQIRREGGEKRRKEDLVTMVDECIDENDRVAIIVGFFPNLPDWLSGEEVGKNNRCRARDGHKLVREKKINEGDWVKKESSPSRSRAIWECTQDWVNRLINEKIESELRNIHRDSKQRFWATLNFQQDLKDLSGFVEVSEPEWIEELLVLGKREAKTTLFLNQEKLNELKGRTNLKLKTNGKEREVQISEVKEKAFTPLMMLFQNPRSFAFLLPAEKAMEIASLAFESYKEEFALSLNALPFNLLLLFMHRKFPLYMTMDAIRRFLSKDGYPSKSEQRELKISADVLVLNLSEEDKEKLHKTFQRREDVQLKEEGAQLLIQAPSRFSDVKRFCISSLKKEPNFESSYNLTLGENLIATVKEFGEEKKEFAFELINQNYFSKPSEDITPSKVSLSHIPGYFDFEFLEASSRRFEIGMDGENLRRPHSLFGLRHSPRPYYIEELTKFKDLWNLLQKLAKDKNLTETKLHNISSLLSSKFEEWGLAQRGKEDEEWKVWEELVKATLQKEFGELETEDLEKFKKAITSGLFFDCIELNRQILKKKLEVRDEKGF